ncbi:hypothetical protein ABID52_003757 [Fictibacillus halophilus]|uniref:Uncharacterized protein n=1 Tax=Fictibacillus halophilus TaxID=1610490 RepID=A0ABV2LNJ3_9BACL
MQFQVVTCVLSVLTTTLQVKKKHFQVETANLAANA